MKKSHIFIFILVSLLILPHLVLAQETDRLLEATARAEKSRKTAVDFESNSYFPSEWEAAERQYEKAQNMPRGEGANNEQAASEYNAAADSFDSILALAIPLFAQAREDELMAVRNALVAAGMRDSFPEYIISPADQAVMLALEQYENADYYAARGSAEKALQMYRILENALYVWHLWWEINEMDFTLLDPDNYNRAREIISDAIDAYLAEDFPAAIKNMKEAEERYAIVLETGWTSYAELRRSLAEGERLAALDTKTNVAARDYFNEAEQLYQTALGHQNTEKYEDAVKQFINAEAMYKIASTSTSEKRSKAATAIRNLNEKIETSTEIARQAADIIYGGSK